MLSPLHRKLLRDLRHARAQALAIALVIAVGVMLLVMMSGLVTSLSQTKAAYYARYRMADVFAPVERAPDRVLGALSSIQGVSRAAGRISGPALIHVAGEPGPLRARLLSLPDDGAPTLNAIRLVRGHTVDAAHPVGCSQHEKLAIIDDRLAVCGGIDLTSDRWDTRAHLPEDPRRRRGLRRRRAATRTLGCW